MSKTYVLPLSPEEISLVTESDTIDLSRHKFPTSVENYKKAILLFIRNTGLKVNFDFSRLSYEDKEYYVLRYLQGNLQYHMKEVEDTWIHILCNTSSTNGNIFTNDELKLFQDRNSDYITEIVRFIKSIPLYTIYYYNMKNENRSDLFDDIQHTDVNNINQLNIGAILLHHVDEMTFMITQEDNSVIPVFYNNYFTESNQTLFYTLSRYPFLNLMNVMMSKEEIQEEFSNKLDEVFGQ